MDPSPPRKPLLVVDADPAWAERFSELAARLRAALGDDAMRIDHIGSTSVPGLAAKDLIDIQVTVSSLSVADAWPEQLLPGLGRRPSIDADHVPPAAPTDPSQWAKRYWSDGGRIHVHVREAGRLNQRYALVFRDYLRAVPAAAGAYGALKRALAVVVDHDWDAYYAVKDPACDLVFAGAEQWALNVGWTEGSSDG